MSRSAVRVLIGCEFSGVVRRAFRALGHDAYSCDLLPSEDASPYHLQCDVRTVLLGTWDIGIFHPPCTYLALSGARWNVHRIDEQEAALDFVIELMRVPYPYALENPIGAISPRIRKPDQIIQPWQFGHYESKATCLWLSRLPPLRPTNIVAVPGRDVIPSRIEALGKEVLERWKERSRTLPGIAQAMAEQWGHL